MTQKTHAAKSPKAALNALTPVFGIVFVLLLFSILTKGQLLKRTNLEVIINQAFSVCIIGIGGMFVFAHGGLDFSIGSAMGMCSYIIAVVIMGGGSPVWALVGSVAFGALSGFLVGATSEFLGLTPFIASLCYSYIWRGVLQVILGYDNLYMPSQFCEIFNNWYLKVAILVGMFLLGSFVFNRTRVGKYQKAIGGSKVVAHLSGVSTKMYVILSHVIMGVCVGIASLFCVARAAQVYPQSGQGYDMDVFVACVLGGMPLTGGSNSRMRSVLIGALTVATLTNGMTLLGVNPNAIDGVTGVIFIIVIALSYKRSRGQVIK